LTKQYRKTRAMREIDILHTIAKRVLLVRVSHRRYRSRIGPFAEWTHSLCEKSRLCAAAVALPTTGRPTIDESLLLVDARIDVTNREATSDTIRIPIASRRKSLERIDRTERQNQGENDEDRRISPPESPTNRMDDGKWISVDDSR